MTVLRVRRRDAAGSFSRTARCGCYSAVFAETGIPLRDKRGDERGEADK